MRKKLLAIVMSLTMILAFIPAMAFAEGSEVTAISYQLSDGSDAITMYEYQMNDGQSYHPRPEDQLIVTTSDGETVVETAYSYSDEEDGEVFISDDGETISLEYVGFELVSDDGEYKINVTYEGKSAQIPVTVLEDPVDSIVFTPVEQKIVYDYYLKDECELTEDGYRYYPEVVEGDSIEITYKDNTTATYKLAEGEEGALWENENDPDDIISMDDVFFGPVCIPESAANDDSFEFYIEYLNVKTSGTVVFKSNNVSRITYTPKSDAITLYKGVDEMVDDGDTYFDVRNAYDYLYGFWNDKVMIEYNDGTPSETLPLDEFEDWDYVTEKNGEYISLREYQQDTPWAVGNTYNIFLKVQGKVDTTNKITVTIENSPVTDFSFTQSTKYLYVFNGGGEEQDIAYDASSDEYYLGDGYYNGYAGAEGDVLTFEYKDGTEKVFEYGHIENDPVYQHGWDGFVTVDGNGNKSRLEREITFDTTGQRWKPNGDGAGHYYNNTVELNYMGALSKEKLKSYVGYQVWFYDEYDENEGDYITHANSCTPIGMSFKESGVDICEPERDGYTLAGWYEMDQNGDLYDKPYNFDEPVTKETFLYAKWIEAPEVEKIDADVSFADNISEEDKEAVSNVTASVQDKNLIEAAKAAADEVEVTVADGLEALQREGLAGDTSAEDVSIVIRTYLDMEIQTVNRAEGSDEIKSVTIEITPKVSVIAALDETDIEIGTNAVVVEEKPITVNKATEVEIRLPEAFADSNVVYVWHNGEEYEASPKDGESATFVFSTNGFSPFVFSKEHTHSLTAHAGNAPACETAGNSAYWSCSICGKYFSDANAENEIEEGSWVIEATGHTLVKVAATAKNIEYYKCSKCGKCFSDAAGTKEISESSTVINATAKVREATLPLKKKQKVNAAANLVLPAGVSVKSVTSSNTKILTVSGTTLKGKKKGKSVVTCTLTNGTTAKYTVKVQNGKVKAKITGVPKSLTLHVGETYQIKADKGYVTCTYKLKYKSSKKKVAKVSTKGLVTARKKGMAKITVKCGSKKKTVKVNVIP